MGNDKSSLPSSSSSSSSYTASLFFLFPLAPSLSIPSSDLSLLLAHLARLLVSYTKHKKMCIFYFLKVKIDQFCSNFVIIQTSSDCSTCSSVKGSWRSPPPSSSIGIPIHRRRVLLSEPSFSSRFGGGSEETVKNVLWPEYFVVKSKRH